MPDWRQVIVSRDVAVLGRVIVAGRQARRERGHGAHRLFIMAQGTGLLIGAAVPLWLQLPLLPVPEMKRLPGRRHRWRAFHLHIAAFSGLPSQAGQVSDGSIRVLIAQGHNACP